eukprot:14443084-Heterocapsa_arctica.AAC.1
MESLRSRDAKRSPPESARDSKVTPIPYPSIKKTFHLSLIPISGGRTQVFANLYSPLHELSDCGERRDIDLLFLAKTGGSRNDRA